MNIPIGIFLYLCTVKGKAAQTTDYIIQTVAPIFNKNGYYGTSMSDITRATGLTKGAVYGNFKNKEELAFAAFKYNVDVVVNRIKKELAPIESPLEQLRGLVAFYRNYRLDTIEIGGCPIINIGVDANHQNKELLNRVKEVIHKLQYYIERMILNAQENGEIRQNIDPRKYGRHLFSLIEGGVFMGVTMEDDTYVREMMDHIDDIITEKLVG